MVTVIFPAAGQGKRMRAGMNKVFLELAGVPILVRTLQKFSQCADVDRLIVVAAAAEVTFLDRLLKKIPGLKPFLVTAGGAERQDSILRGLRCLSPDTDIVLVHDAARPLVDLSTIAAVILAAKKQGAAIAAVRAKNTIKVVRSSGFVERTPERSALWEVQTPQGFQTKILLDAYEKAVRDHFLGTDDASLVERLGIPVQVVEGTYRNIKVTTPEDLLIAEALLHEEKAEGLDAPSMREKVSGWAGELREHFHRDGKKK